MELQVLEINGLQSLLSSELPNVWSELGLTRMVYAIHSFPSKSCVDMTGTLKPDMLESMEPQGQQSKRQLDVTGLPEEAIRAVQSVISVLRGQSEVGHPAFSSREEWARAIKQWADNHPKIDKPADDSRESIYAGRGE